ncbi:hypothetical protein G7075_00380 [Phycicoccus sp. HDW14]|uniref:hypothetical protein n=1 Tax=Phycicoccus sp. HDW14 TaxID=2714941 RepID=UPI00140DA37A|nr:hypothetical protein [Phycicoccus sp. HDW14]QIM19946.1 hypothetical protein G7075_00380 [Phycicoccus sp. HDW14]
MPSTSGHRAGSRAREADSGLANDPHEGHEHPDDDCGCGHGGSHEGSGGLIEGCRISLPPNDVVESIEFDKFFVVNAQLGDLSRPVTLSSSMQAMRKTGFTAEEMDTAAPEVLMGAPLTKGKTEWNQARRIGERLQAGRGEAAARKATRDTADGRETHDTGVNGGAVTAGARLAFYLPYRQDWKLLGYNRGRMVSSITLGPSEEQTIEIFTWDRFSRTSDSTTSFELEQTNESSGTRRDTSDISREVTRQSGFEVTTDAKVGMKLEVVNADFSAGANASSGLNEGDKNARQAVREATSRAATTVRSSRVLKVVETRESGSETRVTRTIRNPNSCHTLTTAYFEVLADYSVETALRADAIKLVVLLESASLAQIRTFDRAYIRSHERTLTLALLDSTLLPGFEAARYLDARERACAILCQGCDCGSSSAPARDPEWDALAAALRALGTAVGTLRTTTTLAGVIRSAMADPTSIPATVRDAFHRYIFTRALASKAPGLVPGLGGLGLSAPTPAVADAAAGIINGLSSETIDALTTVPSQLANDVWWEVWAVVAAVLVDPIATSITTGVIVGALGNGTYNDAGLLNAMASVRTTYATWQARQAELRQLDEARAELERIQAEERALRVLDAFPLRTTADHQERLDALVAHLNDPRNIDHYRFAVWNERAGSADPQLLALAMAGLTEGAPVGSVDDYLAVPLRIPVGSTLESFFTTSVAALKKMSPVDVDEHILPTAALYAEAVPGECCACEDAIIRREGLELDRLELANRLTETEIQRRLAKIEADDLSGPTNPEPFPVSVELVDHTEPAGGTG